LQMARLEYKRSVLNGRARIKQPRHWPTGGLRASHLPAIPSPREPVPARPAQGAPTSSPGATTSQTTPPCPAAEPQFFADPGGGGDQPFRLMQFTDATAVPFCDRIVAWSWNFGDPASGAANASAVRNPQHLYTAFGTYHVTMTVTDDHQASLTFSMDVNVSEPPPA